MTSSAVSVREGPAAEKGGLALLWHALAAAALLSPFVIFAFVTPALRAVDFAAFYCAGESLAEHADPYRAMPLGACEHRIATGPFFDRAVVLPAPLPPYALAAMTIVARVPFPVAQHVLDVLSIAALIMAAVLLGAVTRLGARVALFALGPIAWYVFLLGQPLLVLLAALVACAALLQRRRDGWAAACASMIMIEPHIGVAVCASLFLWRPKTRPVFLAIAVALALISVTVVPWRLTSEYFGSVLPLHAWSEAKSPLQYSATAFLTGLNVPVQLALTLGSIQYLLTLAFGIHAANSMSLRLRESAALVFVPSVFAVLGGTYIHNIDFLLAIPAGLLLIAHTRYVAIVAFAIVALNPYLQTNWGLPGLVLGAICAAIMLVYLRRRALALACLVGLGALATISTSVPPPHRTAATAVPATAYAERSWAEYIDATKAPAFSLARRAPEWLGLIVLCCFAVGRRFTEPSAAARG